MIRMIAACAHNRVMGAGGTLPWKIKADWDYFLDTTKDGVLIMGRRCYEDFTEYAHTRQVVALSRDPEIVFLMPAKHPTYRMVSSWHSLWTRMYGYVEERKFIGMP